MNAVARHWIANAEAAMNHGVSADVAGARALARIFGPAEGAYGAGINRVIEQAWTWKSRDDVADAYLGKMAHAYSAGSWGNIDPEDYRNALTGIQESFHSRATNLYGVVDNDDYFDYFGGLSLAIERVNGKPPENYILFYADPKESKVETLEHFLTKEMRSRYYNPEWIQGMMKEGYAGARTISNKFFEFAWGWQVTNPEIMRDWMWNEVNDIYFHDKYRIGVTKWFHDERQAPAMINMASILLTAANKGFWKARPDAIRDLANTLGMLVVRYGPSCSANVCGNHQTITWSRQWMNATLASSYARAMQAALVGRGYAGAAPVFSSRRSPVGMNKRAGKRLFDFTVDHLPNQSTVPVSFVQAVFRRIQNQDLSAVFIPLLLLLVPAGFATFVVRNRYYRRRGDATIKLGL
jgi:cobaltochelatase CobN